jgi:exopolysaccharide production protein ExoY
MRKQPIDVPTAVVLPMLRSHAPSKDQSEATFSGMLKRSFDFLAALAALVLLFPLLALVALNLWIMQGGPIFIKHRRIGFGGKSFLCLKFRTMVKNADEVLRQHIADDPDARSEWEASRKLRVDPRVTALGHVLRKSSVDELPQLINILKGDMSVVGPRPIVEDEIKHYGADIAHYFKVRPGLTGLWQVSGRSDVTYESRVKLDTAYVDEMNFVKDLAIILKTVPAVIRSRGSY